MKVNVSILSNTLKPQDIVKKLDNTSCDQIHLDIMDGKFTDNKSFTISEVKKITSYSHLKLDVHLMVKNPIKYIEEYALLNTNDIIFHYESSKNINEIIELIKSYGLKVGLAISPDTDVEVLYPYLKDLDIVLLMSVYPGYSGQSFIENTIDKIIKLKNEIVNQNVKTLIEVDGGINYETGLACKNAGADILVSASFIHKDFNNIDVLKKL